MGASSFSPSPITTIPSMSTVPSIRRIASTAAWSADSFCPCPTHRPAARAADSVTRTSSSARLRSGAPAGGGATGSVDGVSVAIGFVLLGGLHVVEHGGGRGTLEQDPVDLGEEGEVEPVLAGEGADLAA